MSGSLNKVQIIGNLGRDPEVRHTADNKPIANVTVATTDSWKDREGQRQEKTEWHRVVIFGGLADVVSKYLKKGDSAYFEGRLQTRKWTDQSGQERYTTEIVVDQFGGAMQMLGKRGERGSDSGASYQSGGQSGGESENTSLPPSAMKPSGNEVPFDDDIPF